MAFQNPDEILQSLTSSGLYRLFARSTPTTMRRRFATGGVEEDVTPGFMPGNDAGIRALSGFQANTVGPQLLGTRGFAAVGDYLGRPSTGNITRDIGGLESEFSMQRHGLIKSISAAQSVGGLFGSQAAGAAAGLGMETFESEAARALAPLIEIQQAGERNRAAAFASAQPGSPYQMMEGRRQAAISAQREQRSKGPVQIAPGVGSVFFPGGPPMRRGPSGLRRLNVAPKPVRGPRIQPPRM